MTAEPDLLPLPSGNVANLIAAQAAEIEALRAEVDEWKDVARCASEQQDSLFREARALNERADKLRAEVDETKEVAVRAMRQRDAQYNRAERLAEALREAQPFIGWTGSYPELHAKIDALLREQEEGRG